MDGYDEEIKKLNEKIAYIEEHKKKIEEEILKKKLLESFKRIKESDRIIERFLEDKEQNRKDEEIRQKRLFEVRLEIEEEIQKKDSNKYYQEDEEEIENRREQMVQELEYQIKEEAREEYYSNQYETEVRCRNAGYKSIGNRSAKDDWDDRHYGRGRWAKK
jgi:hypothetical protein